MKVFVYAESKENKTVQGSLELLTAAAALGNATAIVVEDAEVAAAVAALGTPVTLLKTGDTCPDAQVAALEEYIRSEAPDVVLFSATQLGKDLAPRLAERFGAGCVTDATEMKAEGDRAVFTRPAFGGTVLENVKPEGAAPQFATVRGGCYPKPTAASATAVTEKAITLPGEAIRARIVEAAKEITEAVDLEGADVIVAGGRGMGDAEHFALVKELATLLGGVVGASRPAIEEGWISRAHQVGQSGKIVAPKLYIACGISGAMQHVSGIMGSKYIVAINKDESASIFDIADVGLVGDVKVILPMLMEQIRQHKQG